MCNINDNMRDIWDLLNERCDGESDVFYVFAIIDGYQYHAHNIREGASSLPNLLRKLADNLEDNDLYYNINLN